MAEQAEDLVKALRATALDKDNFPRLPSERHLPVGLALEAADEIERLQNQAPRGEDLANIMTGDE